MARYFLAFALDSFWRVLVAVAWAAGQPGPSVLHAAAAFLAEESLPYATAATARWRYPWARAFVNSLLAPC